LVVAPQISFEITTNGGAGFSTTDSIVTLEGLGWIDVREIYLNGSPTPMEVTWLDGERWRISVPLSLGVNAIDLTTANHTGSPVGSDSITITNTGTTAPASALNLAITEINYYPLVAAEEYLEVTNISSIAMVDLTGVSFADGVEFSFPAATVLAPGERLLVIRDAVAFEARYGTALPVIGVFEADTRLKDEGENIRLEALGGATIREFTYDNSLPWPEVPGGLGHSLVLMSPENNPDHADPLNWRASVASGGAPGETDAVQFVGNPDADDNGDGLSNFLNYALGAGMTGPTIEVGFDGSLILSYPRNLGADDARIIAEDSKDLTIWTPALSSFLFLSESVPVNGISTITLQQTPPDDPEDLTRFIRLRVEGVDSAP
jgi:hypothetical protein